MTTYEEMITRSIYVNYPLPILDAVLTASQLQLTDPAYKTVFSEAKKLLEENWKKIRIVPNAADMAKWYLSFNLYNDAPLLAFNIIIPNMYDVQNVQKYYGDTNMLMSKHLVYPMMWIYPHDPSIIDVLKILIAESDTIMCSISNLAFALHFNENYSYYFSINEIVYKTLLSSIKDLSLDVFKTAVSADAYMLINHLKNSDIPYEHTTDPYNYNNRYVFRLDDKNHISAHCVTQDSKDPVGE